MNKNAILEILFSKGKDIYVDKLLKERHIENSIK